MPIYEYKCEKCGTVFEKRQSFSDETLTTHPECGGPVHRLLSAPAFQLKGTGWYATDYAKGNSSGASSSGNGGEKKESAKSEGGSDSASKTESAPPASASTTTSDSKSS
ncbi:MAG: zinc ribbon domain-containing protein [Bryobacteraceae bacterium]|jgi:putative FmdB family regulatory protein